MVPGSLFGLQVGSAPGRYSEAPEPVLPGLGEACASPGV